MKKRKEKKLRNQKVEAPSFQIFQSCFFFSLYTVLVCKGASLASPSLRDWQTLKGMQGVAAATSASSPSSPSVASSSSSYCHHQQFTDGISSSISDVLGPWRYLVFPLKLLSFFLLVWSVMHETKACLWSTRECRPLGMFDELAAFPWFEHVQTFQCLECDTRKTMTNDKKYCMQRPHLSWGPKLRAENSPAEGTWSGIRQSTPTCSKAGQALIAGIAIPHSQGLEHRLQIN